MSGGIHHLTAAAAITTHASCHARSVHASQVDIERSLPAFKGDACEGQLDDLLRICLRLHAEMAHITTNLQYYINLEVVECELCFFGIFVPVCLSF